MFCSVCHPSRHRSHHHSPHPLAHSPPHHKQQNNFIGRRRRRRNCLTRRGTRPRRTNYGGKLIVACCVILWRCRCRCFVALMFGVMARHAHHVSSSTSISVTLMLCLRISHDITRYRRDEGTDAARSNGGQCRLRRRRIRAGFCFVDPPAAACPYFICCYIVCRLVCLLPFNSLVVSCNVSLILHRLLCKLAAGVAAVSYYCCVLIYYLPIR